MANFFEELKDGFNANREENIETMKNIGIGIGIAFVAVETVKSAYKLGQCMGAVKMCTWIATNCPVADEALMDANPNILNIVFDKQFFAEERF